MESTACLLGPLTRQAARPTVATRRDAYSLVLFDRSTEEVLVNDSTSSPDELLEKLLIEPAGRSTNFIAAPRAVEAVMVNNWCTERLVPFPTLSLRDFI
jgi:hypothetical protein